MKLLCLSDLHLTHRTPESRIDDYHLSQFKKMQHVIEYALENGVDAMALGGDIFHHHTMPDWMKERYIRLFSMEEYITNLPILTIFGQHDMRYHSSDRTNVPLGVLLAGCKNMHPLGAVPWTLKDVNIYGCSYGETIPTPVGDAQKQVLVIHKMIVDEKLWHDQEDYEHGGSFLEDNPEFDLIVSGDNHQTFMKSKRGRRLVNSGSLMRMTSAQMDCLPCFYVWDSKTKDVQQHFIPIAPAESVFSIAKAQIEQAKDEKLESFIAGLKEQATMGLDFRSAVDKYLATNEMDADVKKIIQEAMA